MSRNERGGSLAGTVLNKGYVLVLVDRWKTIVPEKRSSRLKSQSERERDAERLHTRRSSTKKIPILHQSRQVHTHAGHPRPPPAAGRAGRARLPVCRRPPAGRPATHAVSPSTSGGTSHQHAPPGPGGRRAPGGRARVKRRAATSAGIPGAQRSARGGGGAASHVSARA
jgi:hypothetical protein